MLTRYIARRLLLLVPVVFGVTLLVFFSIHLVPGDPARSFLGDRATPTAVAALHREWGLDRPVWVQYWLFVKRLLHGDLGHSLFYQASTVSLLKSDLPVTLLLLLYGAAFAVAIALPLALLAALRPDGVVDQAVRAIGVVGLGMPGFWVGTMLILLLALDAGLFPVAGYGEGFGQHLRSLVLPGLTVALSVAPILIRSLRQGMIAALNSDYVAFARAKGAGPATVLLRYGLRNAAIPAVSVLGVNIGFLVGGTLVIENVFALPGLGSLMVQSILNRDFPVVQGITLVFALLVVLVYLLTDVAYALLDPRVRLG
ncbi:MAG TPA: ABC transporter permease [Solirubrobacteraceae bacterium]|nr:ABC transporter permease [Solirubrobacteraceae bacterium]